MENLKATDAARRFSDILDAVETRGETFLIHRHGKPVARLGPAVGGRGKEIKTLIRAAPVDAAWLNDGRRMREALQIEDRRWTG
jgi:prevent-host-death family protein